jgi:high affinity Mn2+ porin
MTSQRLGIVGFVTLLTLIAGASARAQTPIEPEPPQQTAEPATVFPHPDDTRWWLSGQLNLIGQAHGDFPAAYSGQNSLRATSEQALSRVWTIYTGLQLTKRLDVVVDVESAGGRGLSEALGLAGFTNLDVVRNPSLGSAPYLARAIVHWVIPFSSETTKTPRGPLALQAELPARRLELRAGKIGMVDFFDLNAVGSDSHLQFTNWTIDNNGAYDYDADTRGYTWGVVAEYYAPGWALRGSIALMPTVANGIDMDWDIGRARGQNLELELHPNDRLTVRALAYANVADMGSYADAIQAYRAGIDSRPNIEAHREQGRVKYGFGGNADYATSHGVRFFARTGWNEGQNESFAYTEVNNTVAFGGDVSGQLWGRTDDRVGLAAVTNGLSDEHRDYLALGGLGFILGDGALRYGREDIVETYYTAHLWRGVSASAGAQYITHPGYNQDRGPVLVGALRLHVDF